MVVTVKHTDGSRCRVLKGFAIARPVRSGLGQRRIKQQRIRGSEYLLSVGRASRQTGEKDQTAKKRG